MLMLMLSPQLTAKIPLYRLRLNWFEVFILKWLLKYDGRVDFELQFETCLVLDVKTSFAIRF